MDQEPSHDLAFYLGLQDFEVEAVEQVDDRRWGRAKVVHVVRGQGLHRCPDCDRRHAQGLFDEFEPIRFRDCSIGDVPTFIQVRAMRIACCGGTRVEQLPFAMPGFRMTQRFFSRIAALCTRLPIQAVAAMSGLSWDTVARVDKRAIELALGDIDPSLLRVRWIGVDEVSRTGGHVYFTIVTDLESGRVVWIGDGKGERGFLPFLEALGPRGRRRIRGVVSDLGYMSIVASQLPRAQRILDRFHIVQWMNDALNQLRRRLFSAAPKDALGKTLKLRKWMLLSARERLDRSDKLLLNKLVALNMPLYQAYLLKEELRGILQHPWRYFRVLRRRLRRWIAAARVAALPELRKVADRLEPHIESIVAGHQNKLRMGLVESINSKIAALRVQARGYRDPEYFKLKIFQRCSLPDNPWRQSSCERDGFSRGALNQSVP